MPDESPPDGVPPAPDRTTAGPTPAPATSPPETGRDAVDAAITPTDTTHDDRSRGAGPDGADAGGNDGTARREDGTEPTGEPPEGSSASAHDGEADAVVHARGLAHHYDDVHGVDDVDLDVPTGQILGIVGPSGSGKTTLARLMLGLLPAHEGTIEVLGTDPWEAERNHHTRLGYLPQGNALDPDLTVRHNLDFMASLQGMPWRAKWWPGKGSSDARHRIDDVLELVGLEDEQRTLLRRCSGGEQRRVALGAAIVHDPELLILDEPTAGIDPVLRAQLWEYLTALRDDGHTLVITTQYVTEADECDQVALMVDGRVIRVDSPDGLRREAFGGDLLDVEHDTIDPRDLDLRQVEGVVGIQRRLGPRRVRYLVEGGDGLQARITERFTSEGTDPPLVSAHRPSFDEVFVRLVEEHRSAQDRDRDRDRDEEVAHA